MRSSGVTEEIGVYDLLRCRRWCSTFWKEGGFVASARINGDVEVIVTKLVQP